jgi:hypothetical protein
MSYLAFSNKFFQAKHEEYLVQTLKTKILKLERELAASKIESD